MPMRKLTLTERRILNVLLELPRQSIPIESIAEQSGLTAKRVWVRGRELARFKLARAILHRVYIGPHFTSTFSLQLEPTSAGRRTST
jgi:DNA-binding Lrp family transcriptional regulator